MPRGASRPGDGRFAAAEDLNFVPSLIFRADFSIFFAFFWLFWCIESENLNFRPREGYSGSNRYEIRTQREKLCRIPWFSAPGLDSDNFSRFLDPKNCKWLKMQFWLHFRTDLVALITGMTLKVHLDALEARNWHFKVWYKNRKQFFFFGPVVLRHGKAILGCFW